MSIIEAHKTLDKATKKILKLFPDNLDNVAPPVITIQSKGRKNALGWFGQDRWGNLDKSFHEINISAEHLNRDFLEVIETLIHELVHYVNHVRFIRGQNDKPDCSSSQYHNKIFKNTCEEIGLNCEKMGRFGWASTSLTEELEARVDKFFRGEDRHAFSISRVSGSAAAAAKAPTKMKKWTCACGVNIRAAVDLDIKCNECGEDFWRA